MPNAPPARKKKKKQVVRAGTANGDDGTSQPPHDLPKEAPKRVAASKKESSEPKKKQAKVVKKEEEQEVKQQPMYKCKKNDGKRWHCRRPVSQPDTLCNYHFYQKRAYLDPDFAAVAAAEAAEAEAEEVKEEQPQTQPQPQRAPAASKRAAASKQATSSKPRKKKPGHDAAATEGFYYYAGFGPFRSKRQCRSSNICNMNEPVPDPEDDTPKKDEEEDEPAAEYGSNQRAPNAADGPRCDKQAAAAHDHDASSCDDDVARIAGGDEADSSEEDESYRLGVYLRRANGNGGERKNGGKRWRKPVKARSLKSLM